MSDYCHSQPHAASAQRSVATESMMYRFSVPGGMELRSMHMLSRRKREMLDYLGQHMEVQRTNSRHAFPSLMRKLAMAAQMAAITFWAGDQVLLQAC